MDAIKEDFEARVEEIEVYVNFVKKASIPHSYTGIQYEKNDIPENISPDLKKILKANIYLLLYNLMESSFKKTLKKLIVEVNGSKSGFDILIPEIRKIWLQDETKFFSAEAPKVGGNKTKKSEYYYSVIDNMREHILTIPIEPEISGNLDAKSIRQLSQKYGLTNKKILNLSGEKLLEVKDNRNNLAHGDISFKECGKDNEIGDLVEIKDQVVLFMRTVIEEFDLFIINKSYQTSA